MFKLSKLFQKRKQRFYREPSDPLFEEISESNYRDLNNSGLSMDRSYKKNIKFFLSDIGLPDHFSVSREKFLKSETHCIRLSAKTTYGDFLIRKCSDEYFVVVSYRINKIYKCDGMQGVKQVLYQIKKDIKMKKNLQKILDELSYKWDIKRQGRY